MRYYVTWTGRTLPVEVKDVMAESPGQYTVVVDGEPHLVEVEDGFVLVDGRVLPCTTDGAVGRAHYRPGSVPFAISNLDPSVTKARSQGHPPELRAHMPGKVVEVRAAAGAEVKAGECLAVIEAMKMQNELLAPSDARILRVHVSVGQTVEAGALLLDLKLMTEGASNDAG